MRRGLGAAGEGRFWPLSVALISARPREGGPAPGAPQRPTLAADDLRPERLHRPEPNRSAECVSAKPLPRPITADAFRLRPPQKVSCAGNVTQSWALKSQRCLEFTSTTALDPMPIMGPLRAPLEAGHGCAFVCVRVHLCSRVCTQTRGCVCIKATFKGTGTGRPRFDRATWAVLMFAQRR